MGLFFKALKTFSTVNWSNIPDIFDNLPVRTGSRDFFLSLSSYFLYYLISGIEFKT
jgi:hypothetical protein